MEELVLPVPEWAQEESVIKTVSKQTYDEEEVIFAGAQPELVNYLKE